MAETDLTQKTILTEDDLRGIPENGTVVLAHTARLTPLAQDLVAARALQIVRRRKSDGRIGTIAVGADHGGFDMKRRLIAWLTERGHTVRDVGTYDERPVDYPDIAHAVAAAVAAGNAAVGILLDGAGIGSCMVANKVPGVRAAMCYDAATARNSREHNDANVLTLGAKMLPEERVLEIVETWLSTSIQEERHLARVEKIKLVEATYLR